VEHETVDPAQAAARWYTKQLGTPVGEPDLVKDDLNAGTCAIRVGNKLCLRQVGHVGAHLPLQHSDPSGHLWRLLPTFDPAGP